MKILGLNQWNHTFRSTGNLLKISPKEKLAGIEEWLVEMKNCISGRASV